LHNTLTIHYQQSRRPTDASHRFTFFIQWRSTAGGKDNIWRQIQTTVQSVIFISETVRNRTHGRIHFLLRLTDTMTSQNIDLSFWETQYKWPRALIHKSVIAGGGGMQSPWASESKQQQQQNEYLNLKN